MEIMLINPHLGCPSFHHLTSEQVALLGLEDEECFERRQRLLTATLCDDQVKHYQDVFKEFLERILLDDERIKKYIALCPHLYELDHVLKIIGAKGTLVDLVHKAWEEKYEELYKRAKEHFKLGHE